MKIRQKNTLFGKFLNGVEALGNRLPHPVTMFAAFAVVVVLLSALCERMGVSAVGEVIDFKTMELAVQEVKVASLLNREGLAYMLTHMVSNFTSFAPLGIVLVTMLGVGCAESSGYLAALIKQVVEITPAWIVTPMLVFLGVMSNVAADIGYVLLIPIGAAIFYAYGRHPIAGLAAAFAGVSGGFSANLVIGALDPMLSGVSTEAAGLIDPNYVVQPTANWYFLIVSAFLIVVVGTFVTDRIVEPRLGIYQREEKRSSEISRSTDLTAQEKQALKAANGSLLLLMMGLCFVAVPKNSFLRNFETGSLFTDSPFMEGVIVLITLLFFIPSIVYGKISGVYRSEKEICVQLGENMSAMGGYIALAFVAAQFISYFNYTRLGTVLALEGADLLKAFHLDGPVLMVLFILLTAVINLVMGSASAKWSILGPVFIPMFMLLGYSPELTQVAYRIGDSCTNLITPLMAYFPMIVVFAAKYEKSCGVGTLIAAMLPYSIFFLISWSILLVLWMLLGIPLGPGAAMLLT